MGFVGSMGGVGLKMLLRRTQSYDLASRLQIEKSGFRYFYSESRMGSRRLEPR